MSCKGLHCDGCGGGGGLAVVLIVLAVIAAGAWHVRHGIETGLEIVFWSIVGTAGLAVAGGLVYGALRWRASVLENRSQNPTASAQRPRTVMADLKKAEEIDSGESISPTEIGSDEPISPARVKRQGGGSYPSRLRAIEAPRPASWPLPGQWEEIRPRIGRDG